MIPPSQFKGEIMRWLSDTKNFHWVVPGKLATSESPSIEDLKQYIPLGINSVVNLQEQKRRRAIRVLLPADYDMAKYTREDMGHLCLFTLHLPVKDMKPPTTQQFKDFIDFVDGFGRVTLVHCYSGIGRTGCMAAAYFAHYHGLSGAEAYEKVREIYPYYIQTEGQKAATLAFIDS